MRYATATYHQTKHLDESLLLPAVGSCPWCQSVQLQTLVLVQRSPDVRLLECVECHAISVSRMPSAAALDSYYASYYKTPQYEKSGFKVTLGNPQRMAMHLSRALRKTGIPEHTRILDFGGGDGTVAIAIALELLRRNETRRVSVTVVDYSQNISTPSDKRIALESVRQLEDAAESEYDLVIASAVVEHIPDAPRVLGQILCRVRSGGLLYVRTPQVKAFVLLAKALNSKWDFTFPAHVYDLGQAFWEKYFTDAALRPRFEILSSNPSLVEASFDQSPLRAVLAYLFKMPWYVLGGAWGFVGGWEVVAKRRSEEV